MIPRKVELYNVMHLLREGERTYLIRFLKILFIYDMLIYINSGNRAFSWNYRLSSHCFFPDELINCMTGITPKMESYSAMFMFMGNKKISHKTAHMISIIRKPIDEVLFKGYELGRLERGIIDKILNTYPSLLPSTIEDKALLGYPVFRSILSSSNENEIIDISRILKLIDEKRKK